MMLLADISLSLRGSILLLLLLLAIGVGAAILFYRYTLPPLPPLRRWTLSGLRALSLSLLLLLLFEPIVRIVETEEQPPVLAVLVDNSQSMTITDNLGDRAALVRSWLAGAPFGALPAAAEVRYYAFSSKLSSPLAGMTPQELSFNGQATDIARSTVDLKEQLAKENIQAAVIVSDGNYTVGKNPLYDAEALGIPVYAVGVGDTTEQKDVLVEKVVTNTLAYAETRVPVDITVKSSGYKGENVEVTVADGQTVVERKLIALEEGTQSYPMRLYVEPKEEGTKKYTVRVSSLPGELTGRNNTSSFFMRVLKSKLRVLVLAGAPGPDVTAVRQALVEDERLRVDALVQKNQSEFYERAYSKTLVDSADCLVLIGFPGAAVHGAAYQSVIDAIGKAKKPFLFVNSKGTDYNRLNVLEPYLPFSWSGVTRTEVPVFPAIAGRAKGHPLVILEGRITAEEWSELPPVYKSQTAFRAKPEAEVLAFAVQQGIRLNDPLVVLRNINRQKSLAVTAQSIWQWRLMAQGGGGEGEFLQLLMTNAVRWLTTKEDAKKVRIAPVKEEFTTAEPVEFTGQVYDEQLRPVDDASVTVELQQGGESVELALNAIGNGMYEGALESAAEGDYTYIGRAVGEGVNYGEDRGRLTVGQMNVEFLDTRMNNDLLRQLASATGGAYYDLPRAGNLAQEIAANVRFAPKELTQASEIELWNWQYLVALIVLLLAVEWFIRKRAGMV